MGTTPAFSLLDQPSAAELVGIQSAGTPLLKGTTWTPRDVTNQTPLVGSFKVRTLSVAERLRMPPAEEARDYATSTRHEAVLGLVRLADALIAEDGETPGLFEGIDVWGLEGEFSEEGSEEEDPIEGMRRPLVAFLDPAVRPGLLSALLNPRLQDRADEGEYFSDGAALADRTVALLRQLEGRVKRYRDAIAACQEARGRLQADLGTLRVRERGWSEELEEARHDVSVTRALMAEEQERLDGINARRAAVLEREVRFVAFTRPRSTDALAPAASRPLLPGLVEAPVPACLRELGSIPSELRETLRVVREAPADWFRVRTPLLDRLDRVDLLAEAVRTTQLRARRVQEVGTPRVSGIAMDALAAPGSPALRAAVGKVQVLQQARVAPARSRSLQIDVATLAGWSWSRARAEAGRVVSLGDVIEGGHGQGSVARSAAAFFERFGAVCGCLHEGFSRVVPSIRLDWAEILSEFDDAPNLRNLGSLPRWGEIEHEERRRLQAYADWLFDQVDPREAEARGLVDDVVRMCILLASHAPVGRIVAGRLPRPVTARPGLRIPLLPLDPGRLRVGMEALVYRADRLVARGLVEDLGAGEASAMVTYTAEASVELDETVRVHFAQPATLGAALPGPGGR